MAEISAQAVKVLREKTGAGMMDCKKALVECSGSEEKAIAYLREKGLAKAAKKAGRATSQGVIGSYIHSNGKIGVMHPDIADHRKGHPPQGRVERPSLRKTTVGPPGSRWRGRPAQPAGRPVQNTASSSRPNCSH